MTEQKAEAQADKFEEIEMQPVMPDEDTQKVGDAGKSDKKSLSRFMESDKAAALYTYGCIPNFFESSVPVDQTERPTNKRKSTRYTWPTFFPIAFGLQFKKLVNIFYIVTGILNFFKVLAVNSPFAVLIPVFCIMLLGVVKEFVSELKRSQEDKIVNATPVTRLDTSEGASKDGKMAWEGTTLAELKVGDIIQISDLEQVPADCVLLQVKDNKPECFVKTAALDGERNLKPKLANPQLSANFDTLFAPNAPRGKASLSISCIEPQKELYYFEGRLRACLPDEPEFKMNLSLNQFLHRGSYIENSGSVIAVVVYTGVDSKLILNLGKYVYKMSSFDKILNTIMVLNLLAAIVIALLTAIVSIVWWKDHEEHFYIYENFNSDAIYLIYTFRVYLIVNSFVPLDLLAMLELSKLMFTPIMEKDTEMMVVEPSIRDVVGFKANTLNLPEELAQVEYIFCDKTGTLTQNELVFRALTLQKGQELTFESDKDISEMKGGIEALALNHSESNTFQDFFRCINLCHDCISLKDEKPGKENDVVYNGPSVDEVCLLDMCKDTGIGFFINRDSDEIIINNNGVEEKYGIIKMFPFTSERKAMSMVLQHPSKDKAICYVKGADSSVFPMCEGYGGSGKLSGFQDADGPNNKILEVEKSVEAMAKKGLRTLLYGMKEIDWDGSRDPLDLPVEEIECELTLLAATGVEDLLQENVKECIIDFRDAGISVWMLTGDKGLTALEIGVSCGLIPQERQDMREDQDGNIPTVQNNLATEQNVNDSGASGKGQKVLMFEDTDQDATLLWEKIKRFLTQVKNEKEYAVLISGMVIAVALDNEFTHPELGLLLRNASSVVVYRSSPAQKAEVVTFMKKFTGGKVTLAIGDGANDVNMIQSADLGFGLMGKEGNQAAAFADYAIPRYKDLRRAIFWHGRGYGWRIQHFTILVLMKSIINAIAKYGVTFRNGFSGNQPVDDMLITTFNVLMTNWFVLHYSVYDQEVSFKNNGTIEKESLLPYKMAELYAYSRETINKKRFLYLVGASNVYSVIAGLFVWLVWDQAEVEYVVGHDGKNSDLYAYGVYMTMAVVIAHHIQVAINVRNWGLYLNLWAFISISMLPFALWIANIMPKSKMFKSTYVTVLPNLKIWLAVLLTAVVIVLPLYIRKRWTRVVTHGKFYKA